METSERNSVTRSFAGSVYRTIARLSGRVLGSSDLVDSVFVHRSVATGEVAFGRSDIDMVICVRQPDFQTANGPELALLYERVRALRRFNPAIPHMAVQDRQGIDESVVSDTYLGSLDGRSALVVCGKPLIFPQVPVRRVHAFRRFASYQDSHLAAALHRGDRRNLRKIALDMWNAYAVATGRLTVPFLTRREAEAHRLAQSDAEFSDQNGGNSEYGTAPVFLLAKRLHDSNFPPLKPMGQPAVCRVALAPRYYERSLVVLPDARSAIPAEAFEPGSLLSTPELLHLYLHHFNPFLDWTLPPDLRNLGFSRPTTAEFVRACMFFGHSHTARNPGFMIRDVSMPAKIMALLGHCVPYLQNGEAPSPLPKQELDAGSKHRLTVSEYFRRDFAGIYHQTRDLWKKLECLYYSLESGVSRPTGINAD